MKQAQKEERERERERGRLEADSAVVFDVRPTVAPLFQPSKMGPVFMMG